MTRKQAGFILALGLFVLLLSIPTPETFQIIAGKLIREQQAGIGPEDLAWSMQATCALGALMIVLWLTEAIPLPATALLPAALIPLLHVRGIQRGMVLDMNLPDVVANYAHPVIYLFLGGFLIAAAMQKWKLDRRFTLWLLTRGKVAGSARGILLTVMAATAFLSMWISNTATAAMMLPIGMGILTSLGCKPGQSTFGTSLMLGIAWAASIGGMATIIGTPPNGIALGILSTTFAGDPAYHRITFLDWLKIGLPYVLFFIPIAWVVLMKIFPPDVVDIRRAKEEMASEYAQLGPLTRGEKGTVVMFVLAGTLWLVMPFRGVLLPPSLSDHLSWLDEYAIGILAGTLLFLIPVNLKEGKFLLDWGDVKFVDWGTLILFGGGIALSDALFKSGLASWIAYAGTGWFESPSMVTMLLVVVLLAALLTEVTSNTAVTTMLVPVVISIARATGENPETLAIAVALGASMAFMLPVATPPNALVFGTGYVSLRDMLKGGVVLDLLGWLFTVAVITAIGGWLFHVVVL